MGLAYMGSVVYGAVIVCFWLFRADSQLNRCRFVWFNSLICSHQGTVFSRPSLRGLLCGHGTNPINSPSLF